MQKLWNVPSVTRAATFGSTSCARRSRISRAALFVKVMPRICSGGIPIESIWAIRNVMTRVLPVPAPASTRTGPFTVPAASACSGFSCERKSLIL